MKSSLRAFFCLSASIYCREFAERVSCAFTCLGSPFLFRLGELMGQMLTAIGVPCGAACRIAQSILSASVCLRLAFASC